jgi:glucose/arabinose dehydrogenase
MRLTALGLTFSTGTLLPEQYRRGAFIGEHGSWNRIPQERIQGDSCTIRRWASFRIAIRVFTGFLSREGVAFDRSGRIAIDRAGALLVANDVGNVAWSVTAARAQNGTLSWRYRSSGLIGFATRHSLFRS